MNLDELEERFAAFEDQVENDPIFAIVFAMIVADPELCREIIPAVEADPKSRDEFAAAGGIVAVRDKLDTLCINTRVMRDYLSGVIRERAAGK